MNKTGEYQHQQINWSLLRAQKDHLLWMRNRMAEPHNNETEKDALALDGVIAFLDHIQDEAADRIGEEVVFCDYDPANLLTGKKEFDQMLEDYQAAVVEKEYAVAKERLMKLAEHVSAPIHDPETVFEDYEPHQEED
jgi:hypothetical protein